MQSFLLLFRSPSIVHVFFSFFSRHLFLSFSRNAFLEQYRRENMFSDGLGEFDSARETVKSLQDEYTACQGPDYVNWGEQGERDGSVVGHGSGGSSKKEMALAVDQ